MIKMTKFLEYLESQTKFWKNIFVCISRKKVLSVFYCFLLHENILYTSEVITLLLTSDTIFQRIFGQLFPGLAQILYSFFTIVIAICSKSLGNP